MITSLFKTKDLSQADEILVATVARGRNSGMVYTTSGDTLVQKGGMPLLLEAVEVKLKSEVLSDCTIEVLDHDGLRTHVFVPVKNGETHLKGAEYQTMYYLVRRKY